MVGFGKGGSANESKAAAILMHEMLYTKLVSQGSSPPFMAANSINQSCTMITGVNRGDRLSFSLS